VTAEGEGFLDWVDIGAFIDVRDVLATEDGV
jgi:hypothetical protein